MIILLLKNARFAEKLLELWGLKLVCGKKTWTNGKNLLVYNQA